MSNNLLCLIALKQFKKIPSAKIFEANVSLNEPIGPG